MAHPVSIEQYLSVRSATTPKFAPDGRTLAYLSNESGVWQVWSLDLSDPDAAPRQLTFHDDAVSDIAYAPDRDDLIYVMDSGGDERHQFHLLSNGVASTALTELPDVMHNWGGWSRDGANIAFTANRRDPAFMDAFVMDVASGEATRVFDADGWYTIAAIAPDASRLLLLESTGSSDQELHLLTVKTGERQPFTRHADRCRYQCCRWRADGAGIYALTNQGRDHLGIALFDTASGELVWLCTPDNDVEEIALSKDETRLASVTNIDGYARLAVRDLANGETTEAPPLPPGKITALDWSPDGARLAFALNGSTHNSDIWLWDLNDDTARQITRSDRAGADRSTWIEPQLIHFRTFDDRRIPAFLYLPSGQAPAAGFPAVIFVHGGPESHDQNGWLTGYSSFGQVAAARGFAVFYPNYRGSTGRGVEFSKISQADATGPEFDDLVDAVDHLIEIGLVDRDRVGITGGSYGGYASAWGTTYYSERFAASIPFVGISNAISKMGTTDIPQEMYDVHHRKWLWEDWEYFEKASPIFYATRNRTPTLILHGEEDPRVHHSQSLELYRTLKLLDQAPVRLVFYPGEGHGNARSAARLDYALRTLRWMEHYLTGPGGDPPNPDVDYAAYLPWAEEEQDDDESAPETTGAAAP